MKRLNTNDAVMNSPGVAILECSMLLSVLLLLALGGVSVLSYLEYSEHISRVVDDSLYDSALQPLRLNSAQGELAVVTRHNELTQFMRKVVQSAQAALPETSGSTSLLPGDYMIEAAYAEAEIDAFSGRFTGFLRSPYSEVFSAGTLQIAGSSAARCNLARQFESQAMVQENTGALATPTGIYHREGAALRFIPRAVLVALCVVVHADHGIASRLYGELDGDGLVRAEKAVVLRGDVVE